MAAARPAARSSPQETVLGFLKLLAKVTRLGQKERAKWIKQLRKSAAAAFESMGPCDVLTPDCAYVRLGPRETLLPVFLSLGYPSVKVQHQLPLYISFIIKQGFAQGVKGSELDPHDRSNFSAIDMLVHGLLNNLKSIHSPNVDGAPNPALFQIQQQLQTTTLYFNIAKCLKNYLMDSGKNADWRYQIIENMFNMYDKILEISGHQLSADTRTKINKIWKWIRNIIVTIHNRAEVDMKEYETALALENSHKSIIISDLDSSEQAETPMTTVSLQVCKTKDEARACDESSPDAHDTNPISNTDDVSTGSSKHEADVTSYECAPRNGEKEVIRNIIEEGSPGREYLAEKEDKLEELRVQMVRESDNLYALIQTITNFLNKSTVKNTGTETIHRRTRLTIQMLATLFYRGTKAVYSILVLDDGKLFYICMALLKDAYQKVRKFKGVQTYANICLIIRSLLRIFMTYCHDCSQSCYVHSILGLIRLVVCDEIVDQCGRRQGILNLDSDIQKETLLFHPEYYNESLLLEALNAFTQIFFDPVILKYHSTNEVQPELIPRDIELKEEFVRSYFKQKPLEVTALYFYFDRVNLINMLKIIMDICKSTALVYRSRLLYGRSIKLVQKQNTASPLGSNTGEGVSAQVLESDRETLNNADNYQAQSIGEIEPDTGSSYMLSSRPTVSISETYAGGQGVLYLINESHYLPLSPADSDILNLYSTISRMTTQYDTTVMITGNAVPIYIVRQFIKSVLFYINKNFSEYEMKQIISSEVFSAFEIVDIINNLILHLNSSFKDKNIEKLCTYEVLSRWKQSYKDNDIVLNRGSGNEISNCSPDYFERSMIFTSDAADDSYRGNEEGNSIIPGNQVYMHEVDVIFREAIVFSRVAAIKSIINKDPSDYKYLLTEEEKAHIEELVRGDHKFITEEQDNTPMYMQKVIYGNSSEDDWFFAVNYDEYKKYRNCLNIFEPFTLKEYIPDSNLPNPDSLAKFILECSRKNGVFTTLNGEQVGEYVSTLSIYSLQLLFCIIKRISSSCNWISKIMNAYSQASAAGKTGSDLKCIYTIIDCMRDVLDVVIVPGEAQKIERIMEVFSHVYSYAYTRAFEKTEKYKPVPDSVFTLAFAAMMLNTDLHNPNVEEKSKMSAASFLSNTRAALSEDEVPDGDLYKIYETLKAKPFNNLNISMGEHNTVSGVISLMNPQLRTSSTQYEWYDKNGMFYSTFKKSLERQFSKTYPYLFASQPEISAFGCGMFLKYQSSITEIFSLILNYGSGGSNQSENGHKTEKSFIEEFSYQTGEPRGPSVIANIITMDQLEGPQMKNSSEGASGNKNSIIEADIRKDETIKVKELKIKKTDAILPSPLVSQKDYVNNFSEDNTWNKAMLSSTSTFAGLEKTEKCEMEPFKSLILNTTDVAAAEHLSIFPIITNSIILCSEIQADILQIFECRGKAPPLTYKLALKPQNPSIILGLLIEHTGFFRPQNIFSKTMDFFKEKSSLRASIGFEKVRSLKVTECCCLNEVKLFISDNVVSKHLDKILRYVMEYQVKIEDTYICPTLCGLFELCSRLYLFNNYYRGMIRKKNSNNNDLGNEGPTKKQSEVGVAKQDQGSSVMTQLDNTNNEKLIREVALLFPLSSVKRIFARCGSLAFQLMQKRLVNFDILDVYATSMAIASLDELYAYEFIKEGKMASETLSRLGQTGVVKSQHHMISSKIQDVKSLQGLDLSISQAIPLQRSSDVSKNSMPRIKPFNIDVARLKTKLMENAANITELENDPLYNKYHIIPGFESEQVTTTMIITEFNMQEGLMKPELLYILCDFVTSWVNSSYTEMGKNPEANIRKTETMKHITNCVKTLLSTCVACVEYLRSYSSVPITLYRKLVSLANKILRRIKRNNTRDGSEMSFSSENKAYIEFSTLVLSFFPDFMRRIRALLNSLSRVYCCNTSEALKSLTKEYERFLSVKISEFDLSSQSLVNEQVNDCNGETSTEPPTKKKGKTNEDKTSLITSDVSELLEKVEQNINYIVSLGDCYGESILLKHYFLGYEGFAIRLIEMLLINYSLAPHSAGSLNTLGKVQKTGQGDHLMAELNSSNFTKSVNLSQTIKVSGMLLSHSSGDHQASYKQVTHNGGDENIPLEISLAVAIYMSNILDKLEGITKLPEVLDNLEHVREVEKILRLIYTIRLNRISVMHHNIYGLLKQYAFHILHKIYNYFVDRTMHGLKTELKKNKPEKILGSMNEVVSTINCSYNPFAYEVNSYPHCVLEYTRQQLSLENVFCAYGDKILGLFTIMRGLVMSAVFLENGKDLEDVHHLKGFISMPSDTEQDSSGSNDNKANHLVKSSASSINTSPRSNVGSNGIPSSPGVAKNSNFTTRLQKCDNDIVILIITKLEVFFRTFITEILGLHTALELDLDIRCIAAELTMDTVFLPALLLHIACNNSSTIYDGLVNMNLNLDPKNIPSPKLNQRQSDFIIETIFHFALGINDISIQMVMMKRLIDFMRCLNITVFSEAHRLDVKGISFNIMDRQITPIVFPGKSIFPSITSSFVRPFSSLSKVQQASVKEAKCNVSCIVNRMSVFSSNIIFNFISTIEGYASIFGKLLTGLSVERRADLWTSFMDFLSSLTDTLLSNIKTEDLEVIGPIFSTTSHFMVINTLYNNSHSIAQPFSAKDQDSSHGDTSTIGCISDSPNGNLSLREGAKGPSAVIDSDNHLRDLIDVTQRMYICIADFNTHGQALVKLHTTEDEIVNNLTVIACKCLPHISYSGSLTESLTAFLLHAVRVYNERCAPETNSKARRLGEKGCTSALSILQDVPWPFIVRQHAVDGPGNILELITTGSGEMRGTVKALLSAALASAPSTDFVPQHST